MGGKPIRLKLKLVEVRQTADSHGVEWNHELVRRLKACARTIVLEERANCGGKKKSGSKTPRRRRPRVED